MQPTAAAMPESGRARKPCRKRFDQLSPEPASPLAAAMQQAPATAQPACGDHSSVSQGNRLVTGFNRARRRRLSRVQTRPTAGRRASTPLGAEVAARAASRRAAAARAVNSCPRKPHSGCQRGSSTAACRRSWEKAISTSKLSATSQPARPAASKATAAKARLRPDKAGTCHLGRFIALAGAAVSPRKNAGLGAQRSRSRAMRLPVALFWN